MTEKRYEDLFFTDDFMFCKVMQNESICRRVIKVLLGIDAGKLTYLNKQQDMRPGYSSRGIRLDVVARDTGRIYDIEMQTAIKGDLPKRARYYQAAMDVDTLEKRQPYSDLPDSFVVFICTQDPFGGGLPRYTVKNCCLEDSAMNKKVDDKTLKMYYNVKEWEKLAENDAEVKAFLRFLATQTPQSPLTEDIMEQVMYARGSEPWRVEFMQMRELRDEGYNDGYEDGMEQGREHGIEQGRAEQFAADKAEIAQLKARIAELEAR